MIGNLTPSEVEHLLHTQHIGHLGFEGEGQVYVFPIAIGYDGVDLYGHSRDGLKVRLMRAHPEVCVEVEAITTPTHWRTALVHGRFEEITDPNEQEAALIRIAQQGDETLPMSMAPYMNGPEGLIVFRIAAREKTGRYEQDEVFPAHDVQAPRSPQHHPAEIPPQREVRRPDGAI